VVGEHMLGDRKIACEGVVIGGRWWHPEPWPEVRRAQSKTERY